MITPVTRALRSILILPVAVLCVLFLIRFAQVQVSLWEMRDGPGVHLLAEPHFCIYGASGAGGERDGWQLFLLADPPEGTRSVFRFPTWPLAVASIALLVGLGVVKRR